jgi:hypothetical protein
MTRLGANGKGPAHNNVSGKGEGSKHESSLVHNDEERSVVLTKD